MQHANTGANRCCPIRAMLFSRIGPEIVSTVPAVKVRLVAFGEDTPLRFDVNTVQDGIMRLIPGITEAEVARWTAERAKKPFADAGDFRRRRGAASGHAGKHEMAVS